MITGGREAAATLWEPITPNSWELSLIYDAVSTGNEGVAVAVRPAQLGTWAAIGLGQPKSWELGWVADRPRRGPEVGFSHLTCSVRSW